MKKRDKVIIGALSIVGLLIVGLWGVDTTGFISVTEVISDPQYIGRDIKVLGTVKEGTLQVNPISFVLTDGKSEITIEYVGDELVNITEGGDVVVYGKLISNEKIEARKIIFACPTMYLGRVGS
ncbi:MAG: cytochrome c maturation protein CcmE [Methanocellales archaeon]|nr:cytochrome c maturation protein CcmE [Methanocellales archaeon]